MPMFSKSFYKAEVYLPTICTYTHTSMMTLLIPMSRASLIVSTKHNSKKWAANEIFLKGNPDKTFPVPAIKHTLGGRASDHLTKEIK